MNGKLFTGTVASAFGVNGLLQTLIGLVCGTKVTHRDLVGGGSSYGGTLPEVGSIGAPVGIGSFIVTYNIAGVDYLAYDDGAGNVSGGTELLSGSIVYATGVYSLTFDSAPSSAPWAQYIIGEEGADWELKFMRNTRNAGVLSWTEPFADDCQECILHNRGLSGEENVLIGIREWKYTTGNAYNWDLNGYVNYVDDQFWNKSGNEHGLLTYDATWNHYSYLPVFPLIDDTMYYWIYSNRQRIIVVTRIVANYESCYLGFADRFGDPSDYPYPLVVKGPLYGNLNHADTSRNRYIPMATSSNNFYLLNVLPDGSWALNSSGTSNMATILYPYNYWYNQGPLYLSPGGDALLNPVIGVNMPTYDVLWQLDGVLHAAGYGLQSEDIIKVAEEDLKFLVFQNVYRSDYFDFMAVSSYNITTTTTTTTTTV